MPTWVFVAKSIPSLPVLCLSEVANQDPEPSPADARSVHDTLYLSYTVLYYNTTPVLVVGCLVLPPSAHCACIYNGWDNSKTDRCPRSKANGERRVQRARTQCKCVEALCAVRNAAGRGVGRKMKNTRTSRTTYDVLAMSRRHFKDGKKRYKTIKLHNTRLLMYCSTDSRVWC